MKLRDWLLRCGVDGLAEAMVVLEEGEATAFLGVLEPSGGGAVGLELGVGVAGDEGEVRGGQEELPAAPEDPAAESDVACGECAGSSDGSHTEGFADELDARGEREDAGDGRVDGCGLGDEERIHTATTVTCACSLERDDGVRVFVW